MNPEVIAVFIPIIIFMIPIVAILTSHQRKMAEILHANHKSAPSPEVQALRYEIAQMRDALNQQMMAIDDLRRSLPASQIPPHVHEQKLG